MNKQQFTKAVIKEYQEQTGDYIAKDDYQYEPILNKVHMLFHKGVSTEEAVDELDKFIDNM